MLDKFEAFLKFLEKYKYYIEGNYVYNMDHVSINNIGDAFNNYIFNYLGES